MLVTYAQMSVYNTVFILVNTTACTHAYSVHPSVEEGTIENRAIVQQE